VNFRVKLPYSLKHSLECGQVFRWELDGNSFVGVVGSNIFRVGQIGDVLTVASSDSKEATNDIRDYLNIDMYLASILKEIDVDEHIHDAIVKFKGLRILKQQPWECFISFILSQNSNIPRIKKMIINVSKFYGKEILLNGYKNFRFPLPSDLTKANGKDLKTIGLGYRAHYIIETSKKFLKEEDKFLSIFDKSYEEAEKYLLDFPGVGDKVANCTLLFAFKKYEAFPVDTWVRRIIGKLYFKGKENLTNKKIKKFARRHFGRFCGYAQQYLFYSHAIFKADKC